MARGWTGAASLATRAADKEVRFGEGILRELSHGWGPYVLVTGRRSLAAAEGMLDPAPVVTRFPSSLVDDELRQLATAIPDEVELVVGLGGGMALDASKYVSIAIDRPLVVVPSVTSTGAVVNSSWGQFDGVGQIRGTQEEWPWADAEYIVVDPALLLQAPSHLNVAGLGDSLCWYAGIAEWWHDPERIGHPRDEDLYRRLIEQYEAIVTGLEATLDDKGELTGDSLLHIVRTLPRRAELHGGLTVPKGEHAFERYLEIANGRSWVHGEMTALGAVIVAWSTGDASGHPVDWFDRCGVRWRPLEQDIERTHLERGLAAAPTALPDKGPYNWDTILRNEPIVGKRFDALWEFLTS